MRDKRFAYEDLEVGAVLPLGTKQVSADEIKEFARQFDMQPMHLDEQAGNDSILGGLSASGWHSCAIYMRMVCDSFLSDSTSQGAPGVDYVKWRKPVLAGDVLSGRVTILSKRLSASRPGLGLVTIKSELVNQRDETTLELQNTGMFLTRDAAAAS